MASEFSEQLNDGNETAHEQGTVYVDSSNLDIVLSTKPPSMLSLFWKELRHDILAFISLILLVALIAGIYVGSPLIQSRMDVMRNDLLIRNQSPEELGLHFENDDTTGRLTTMLGTDSNGRFIAPLLVVSARNSLNVALAVTALSFLIGLIVGIISGFYGGTVDNIIMRITDTVTMLPIFMVMIAIISIAPTRSTALFILIFTMFTWMGRTRLIRAAALQNRNLDYISASKTLGTRNIVIIFREMLPNLVDVIVANFVLTTAANIGIETGFSMLGFGMGMEYPSLGVMISNAMQTVNLNFRWWTWAPAVILVVTIMLCINFVGNVLQRVADPRQRLV